MRYSRRTKKCIALTLLVVLTSQIVLPNVALALTTGPTQPEVQSFEPVGTTDMVDMFSGDFTYNVPLMDVEGYPINISYHGGINMEQEASWVGLGWNINPGVINRTVRGLPDDFKGDILAKELHIKDETTLRVGIGGGGEIAGLGDPLLSLSASLGANVTFNNYRGTSVDFDMGAGINLFKCASVGVNIGVGSATGADIDYNANLSLSSSQIISKDMAAGVGIGVSQGYSTRSGIKDLNLSFSVNAGAGGVSTGHSFTNTIPIGLKNYVPVITNSSTMNSYFGRVKFGGELFWCLGYATANGMFSRTHYKDDGSRDAYGYLYMQNKNGTNSILDFTRDKDGQFNKTMQYLPPANFTYDIYSVNGQGTGGMFRPYRNDFGSAYDPSTSSSEESWSVGLEAGLGWIFEIGGDETHTSTHISSGPWADYLRAFSSRTNGSVYEEAYLKQGGELTEVDSQYFADINQFNPIDPSDIRGLPATKAHSSANRDPRGNLIYYFTGKEDTSYGVGSNPNIVSYTTDGFSSGADASKTTISRIGANPLEHKKDEISEIVQLQKDGRKYVYGLPALNHIQKEVTFSTTPGAADLGSGLTTYTSSDDGPSNGNGRDNYYSSTITPSYVHSYLLTSVLSPDYVDVTGNGPSDDDLGTYTKMNYSLKDADYRWKAPFGSNRAQYNRGYLSDTKDDKASYVCGSREQWYLHSIETKNFVAEFFTSQRDDACGSSDPIVSRGVYNLAPYNGSHLARSYKLDSIKLYNKHDRFINTTNAVPVKTVFFVYEDTLCRGIPNTTSSGHGKLTLSKIYFRYGNSQKSMISPYQFNYGYNPDYNAAYKDRWGGYKPNNPAFPNYEFPFVNQSDPLNDTYAGAWSLTGITLPSGGRIETTYEADDYAYVQDSIANEMFVLQGIGNTPNFSRGTYLYFDEWLPQRYVYFKRKAGENGGLSFKENYLLNENVYYNFNVRLNNSDRTFEQIKGYAKVDEIGACPGGVYGYIKLKTVVPTGGEAELNPVSYTAINTGRYSLPNVLYPGSSSDAGGFDVLDGLHEAFDELVSMGMNPVTHMVKKDRRGQMVNLSKSYLRLHSVGMHKKGGGQRVKFLKFYDSWNALAGGNEQEANYGKSYGYYVVDDKYGAISSGVASYEPEIGGDENPLRQPVPYIVSSGSNWPPNDPVDLYQETPIGESLFPSPSVGYSKITVASIHQGWAKSAQGRDVYQFYTAKDFPAQVISTAINTSFSHHFDLFSQDNSMTATQGYSLIFNDMHGKPKSVEHFVTKPQTGETKMVSYQVYNYKMSGGLLDNHVNCLVYDPVSHRMKIVNKQLGVEADVTVDTRMRNEETNTSTINANLNFSGFFLVLIPVFFPIILSYPWEGDYTNKFACASVTKVVQQYGILDNVQSFNEGAVTIQKNEVFDPQTGQVVVTSINNEYHDKEYTANIPAYWTYSAMGPAYQNIKYEVDIPSILIQPDRRAKFTAINHLNVGDEILMDFKDPTGTARQTIVWFLGTKNPGSGAPCEGYILPRFPLNTPGWSPSTTLTDVHLKVVRSFAKNLLNETIQTYTMMDNPVDLSGYLKTDIDSVISLKARTFSDSTTRIPYRYIANADTINPFASGARGNYRLLSEYAYVVNRNYSGVTARNSGLFNASLPSRPIYDQLSCTAFPYNFMEPTFAANWQRVRTITKWSPNGKEVENRDALGIYSSAVYGYSEELPTAVAANAQQGEVLTDGFEDYELLRPIGNVMGFNYSPFSLYFGTTALPHPSITYNYLNPVASNLSVINSIAHTGKMSVAVTGSSGGVTGVFAAGLPINFNSYTGLVDNYNTYFAPPVGSSIFNFNSTNEYLPFKLTPGKKYIASFWVKEISPTANPTTYTISDSCGVKIDGTLYPLAKRSNIIDGWQQVEIAFTVPSMVSTATLRLPVGFYVDDIRCFPSDANMKSFVYNPVNEKLMATLDENNFATMYEYDQEGNLVRVKKETEKGIMTISESRSNNPKQ